MCFKNSFKKNHPYFKIGAIRLGVVAYTPLIPTPKRQRQAYFCEFEAGLVYI